MTGDDFDPFALESNIDPLHHQLPASPHPRRNPPATSQPTAIGAGNRLAHLPPGAELETAAGRVQALEDEVAILTACLDNLPTSLTTRLDRQRDQLLQAVTTLLDQRTRARR